MNEQEAMTLEEAISHARKKAKSNRSVAMDNLVSVYTKTQCEKCAEEHEQLAEWLEELKEYRALGTVEELREAREKQIPYKPKEYEDRYYACKCGNPVMPKWDIYPTKLKDRTTGLSYCLACGQNLDWSE